MYSDYLYMTTVYFECDWCLAGKIHISDETKSALDTVSDVRFDIELRGEIDVKVNHQ